MSPLDVAVPVATALLCAALVLTLVRTARGPSLPDRLVALDLAATLCVGICGARSIAVSEPLYLSVATVIVVVSFAGTVAFARYIESRRPE